jgi:hypothetical protein
LRRTPLKGKAQTLDATRGAADLGLNPSKVFPETAARFRVPGAYATTPGSRNPGTYVTPPLTPDDHSWPPVGVEPTGGRRQPDAHSSRRWGLNPTVVERRSNPGVVRPSKGLPWAMEISCHVPSPPAVVPHASPKGRPRRAGEPDTGIDRGTRARVTSSPRKPLMSATPSADRIAFLRQLT